MYSRYDNINQASIILGCSVCGEYSWSAWELKTSYFNNSIKAFCFFTFRNSKSSHRFMSPFIVFFNISFNSLSNYYNDFIITALRVSKDDSNAKNIYMAYMLLFKVFSNPEFYFILPRIPGGKQCYFASYRVKKNKIQEN